MGALVGCSRVILVVINGIFSLIGLVFLVIGCLFRFGSGALDPYLDTVYSALSNFIVEASGNSVDLSTFNVADYIQDATLAIILLGVIFFIIGIFGCVGACCKVRCMLVVYAVLVSLIVTGELLFVILLFAIRDTVDSNIKSPMRDSIRDKYTGFNGTNFATLGWNFAMVNFGCCGVDNYTDFNDANFWVRQYTPTSGDATITLVVPIACCKLYGTSPDVQLPGDLTCATSPNTEISHIEKGCYEAFWDFFEDNRGIFIGIAVAVIAVQILLIIFTCIICCEKEKVGPY